LEEGRIDEANLLFDQMASLSRTLLAMCNSVPTVILPYLESENPNVRKWFAFLALEFEPAAGERVLEELAAEFIYKGVPDSRVLQLGFGSQMTLKRWRRGDLLPVFRWEASGK
jgi:hypothetical protein